MINQLEKLGRRVSTDIGVPDDEFRELRSAREDVEVKSLGYAVYSISYGHLIGEGEGGLDTAGGWFYGSHGYPETYELTNGSDIMFLDGWPTDMWIFSTKEDAEKAIEIVISLNDENTRDDFDIYEVYTVKKVVSTLAFR